MPGYEFGQAKSLRLSFLSSWPVLDRLRDVGGLDAVAACQVRRPPYLEFLELDAFGCPGIILVPGRSPRIPHHRARRSYDARENL